ncbi:MAG: guanylate kinase [Bacilli bacterium]|nr:guanylate kinase [Bacilli bacterium]MDY6362743.1 guanylate kinase [Bacilli bacterium]
MKKRGLLIIMSGPSGVGKGTIREELMKKADLNLHYSVSMTTRGMRPGEVNGREYYFVSREEFDQNIKNDNLLEWAEFVGNRYGTPRDKVEQMRNEGKNVMLEIEVNGTAQVLNKVHDDGVISIFIAPPSLEELEKRLRGRGTESDEVIKSRVAKATQEFAFKDQYKYIVVNDDLSKAVDEVRQIILKAMKGE